MDQVQAKTTRAILLLSVATMPILLFGTESTLSATRGSAFVRAGDPHAVNGLCV